MTSLPRDRMDQVVKRFDMLEALMAAGPEPEAYVKMASEYSEIQEMAGKIRALRAAEQELADLESMLADKATDAEMRALAEADMPPWRSASRNCSRKSRSCCCRAMPPTTRTPS
jgi:peptide chain release factor 1